MFYSLLTNIIKYISCIIFYIYGITINVPWHILCTDREAIGSSTLREVARGDSSIGMGAYIPTLWLLERILYYIGKIVSTNKALQVFLSTQSAHKV